MYNSYIKSEKHMQFLEKKDLSNVNGYYDEKVAIHDAIN